MRTLARRIRLTMERLFRIIDWFVRAAKKRAGQPQPAQNSSPGPCREYRCLCLCRFRQTESRNPNEGGQTDKTRSILRNACQMLNVCIARDPLRKGICLQTNGRRRKQFSSLGAHGKVRFRRSSSYSSITCFDHLCVSLRRRRLEPLRWSPEF